MSASASLRVVPDDSPVVCRNIASPLSSVIAHRDVECIERFFAAGFPVHLAVHRVHAAEPKLRDYTELHSHPPAEINVFIPDPTGLEYEVQIGDEVFRITEHTSVWIPPHVPHSANVISGSGYFMAMRLREPAAL